MKLAVLFTFMVGGLLFAKDPSQLSSRERLALRTSSPPVHTASNSKHKKARSEDRVVTDKTTINAFVPVGK